MKKLGIRFCFSGLCCGRGKQSKGGKEENKYPIVSQKEYDKKFGVHEQSADNSRKPGKQEQALERAWITRNYEIDKFWQRSQFFWVFIAFVFTAYGAVQIGNPPRIYDTIPYIELYLILLGIIVSVAWLLVIKGSKFWQENWEAHIDRLEDDITGPLHKTVYTNGKNAFSVSRINEMLAWVVIVVWGLLFLNFFANCDCIKTILDLISPYCRQLIGILVPVGLAIFVIIMMKTKGQSSGGKYKIGTKQSNGVFVNRSSDNSTKGSGQE
jgi:hypothetical protein